MKKKFETFIDKFNMYFAIPVIVCFLLSSLSIKYAQSIFGVILNVTICLVVVIFLSVLVYKLIKGTLKNSKLIWPLVVSLVLIILSLIVLKTDAKTADTLFIAGVIFFEIYSLFVIINSCLSENTNITKTIIFSLIFVILGYISIYASSYGLEENTIFNSLMTLFSSIIGGGITLVGVAWTINHNKLEKRKEEEQKAKPVVFICNPRTVSLRSDNLLKALLYSYNEKGTLKKAQGNKTGYVLPQILIDNSDYSHVIVRGFRVNDDFHIYDYGQVLPKDETLYLKSDFRFKYSKKINYVSIILQDMMENLYELVLNFTIVKDRKDNVIKINSGIETKKTTLNINPKEI